MLIYVCCFFSQDKLIGWNISENSKSISDGKDPEGPPYIQYEEVPPTRESNALIGSLLTVDENRHSLYIRTVSSYDMLSAY